tara:strand:+ start:1878 stop:3140 length:1263 start_codon:yes stop_codon:yes gene_type:complete
MFKKIGIIGLGYVGLPLAIEFGKKFDVIGYDINKKRVKELKKKIDSSKELNLKKIRKSKTKYTNNYNKLANCDCFIITVPTPLNKNLKPDLSLLNNATKIVRKFLKKNDTIIYESTVYPGTTDKISIPILSKKKGFIINKNFFVGYSPERINPGDKKHNLKNVIKLISASNKKTLNKLEFLYKKVVKAGVFRVKNIKTAEAAKIIENTQRDLNIALINEFSLIFKKLNIDTNETLEAARTKWNFLDFKPGLVGGHCIGVDPYYLAYISKKIGYNPKIILAGRKLNDKIAFEPCKFLIKKLKKKHKKINNLSVLIFGVTFKENVSDTRNSKTVDMINFLRNKKINVDAYDPEVLSRDFFSQHGLKLKKNIKKNYYDAVILSVPHLKILKMGLKKIKSFGKSKSMFLDLKGIFNKKDSDYRL